MTTTEKPAADTSSADAEAPFSQLHGQSNSLVRAAGVGAVLDLRGVLHACSICFPQCGSN